MKADRIKGHLDLLLLGVLAAGPMHGYAVIVALRERSAGVFELTEGAVYPALHRLEEAGLLRSDWQVVAGRRRRLYRLTDSGRRSLAAEQHEWQRLADAVRAVLRPAVAGAS